MSGIIRDDAPPLSIRFQRKSLQARGFETIEHLTIFEGDDIR